MNTERKLTANENELIMKSLCASAEVVEEIAIPSRTDDVAAALLHYFTESNVVYEDQPDYVKVVWRGAAHAALAASSG